MSQFAPLGIFLILAFIFPGMIIAAVILALFPEVRNYLPSSGAVDFAAITVVTAFLNGHPAHMCERYVLDPIWDRIYRSYRIKERVPLMIDRSKIITRAEIKGLPHGHYDEVLGEFVLFNNCGFWLFLISAARIVVGFFEHQSLLAVVIFASSTASLLFSSPLFKKLYLDTLETLDAETRQEPV